MQTALSIGLDALAYGMVLFVIAIGLSITMGLMRVVNLAHGAFAMVGGYIASYAVTRLGWSYGAALALAVAATVVLAIPLERLLYRRIYGHAQALPQILMTIGISFLVIGGGHYLFGPTLKAIPLPSVLRESVDICFRTVAAHRLFAIACGAAIALALWLVVERTRFGVRLRAAVDNASMAAALGVRTEVVYAVSFAL